MAKRAGYADLVPREIAAPAGAAREALRKPLGHFLFTRQCQGVYLLDECLPNLSSAVGRHQRRLVPAEGNKEVDALEKSLYGEVDAPAFNPLKARAMIAAFPSNLVSRVAWGSTGPVAPRRKTSRSLRLRCRPLKPP